MNLHSQLGDAIQWAILKSFDYDGLVVVIPERQTVDLYHSLGHPVEDLRTCLWVAFRKTEQENWISIVIPSDEVEKVMDPDKEEKLSDSEAEAEIRKILTKQKLSYQELRNSVAESENRRWKSMKKFWNRFFSTSTP